MKKTESTDNLSDPIVKTTSADSPTTGIQSETESGIIGQTASGAVTSGQTAEGPIILNLHEILRKRMTGKASRLLPGFLITRLEKLIRQDELNEILRVTYPARGSEFSARVLDFLNIEVEVVGLDRLPEGRFMFASNHPLGGLDGITLIALLGKKYGDEGVRFLVNDMLMNVEPLRDVFLPINKFGSQGRMAAKAINEALASDRQILQFPAGLVSRLQKGGIIADLEWQKAFVSKAIQYERDIVPVKFEALNTKGFYKKARLRKRLGIKFNLEQILLPGEVCKSRGKKFRVIFGEPISVSALRSSGKPARQLAAEIRDLVYSLPSNQ